MFAGSADGKCGPPGTRTRISNLKRVALYPIELEAQIDASPQSEAAV